MNMKFLCASFLAIASCNAVPADSSADLSHNSDQHIVVTPSGVVAPDTDDAFDTSLAAIEASERAIEAISNDFWIAKDAQQGAVINAKAPSGAVSVTLNGANLPLSDDGFFLMGFDRDASAAATLVATLADGSTVQKTLSVAQGQWRLENINAPYRAGRTNLAFQQLRGPEIAQIVGARKIETDAAGWRQDFIWPVKGRISGRFGAQRVYQGKPGSYHSGLDVAAPTGTPYVAPADGVVILAAQKPFTLEGNLLMIDHGNGLNSAFLHSSSISVKLGDKVVQGQEIGRVGATGRATGPHLHWGMKWNNARVDPLLLLPPQ